MNSPLAQTKGFILDLTFTINNLTWSKIIRDHHLLGPVTADGKQQEFTHIIELDIDDDDIR